MGKLDRSPPTGLELALHHPLRLRLLDLMLGGTPADARALAAVTGEPVSRVSYHLGVLAQCGLSECEPRGETYEDGPS